MLRVQRTEGAQQLRDEVEGTRWIQAGMYETQGFQSETKGAQRLCAGIRELGNSKLGRRKLGGFSLGWGELGSSRRRYRELSDSRLERREIPVLD